MRITNLEYREELELKRCTGPLKRRIDDQPNPVQPGSKWEVRLINGPTAATRGCVESVALRIKRREKKCGNVEKPTNHFSTRVKMTSPSKWDPFYLTWY